MTMKGICIIGAGTYGCALAQVFSNKYDVYLVSRNPATAKSVNECHVHPSCLCGISLSRKIKCLSDYEEINRFNTILICTPVSAIRSVCQTLKTANLSENKKIILCSKGVEIGTGLFTSEIAKEILDNEIFVLSGPSFAHEIASNLPSCVSLAGKNLNVTKELSQELSTEKFLITPNDDLLGTQVCGAFKNVLAVMCGVVYGLSLGESAVSFLISKSLTEIRKMIDAVGGKSSTILEVCGIGDIILTCTNEASRNVSFGKFIARRWTTSADNSEGAIEAWTGDLAEGALTAKTIPEFVRKGVDLPIFMNAYNIIYNRANPNQLLETLMHN